MFRLVPAHPGSLDKGPFSQSNESISLLLYGRSKAGLPLNGCLLTGSYSHITQHCVFVLGYVSISIGPCCSQMHATVNCKIHRCHHSNVM